MTTDTPARLLQLLSLLQTPREWPGGELSERLGVSRRTVRRDIDRLRELGYPVQASKGSDGGYRLVAGKAMPPLVLDDEEAVAIAVGLRAGAGHALEGVDEASVRALAKLEQVLPARLRHRVSTLQAATTPLTSGDGASIAPETLTAIASTVAGQERLRFAYHAKDGTQSRRLAEPYRLVSTDRRWYLVAYDLDREDWRTFRVDRIRDPFATGARFTPRELPTGSAAEYLRRSIRRRSDAHEYELDVTFEASPEFVATRLPAWLGTPVANPNADANRDAKPDAKPVAAGPSGNPEDSDSGAVEGGCRLQCSTSDPVEWVAVRLAMLGCEFSVRGPAELAECVRELGGRLGRAGGV
ncbi:YafY family transcriptional regulator [Streptomyces sp. NBC_01485]|uniref:helix-turn-helix transcriptional regulator n=1 Tax=Streptomyces sp. NBC_01485 TaxID=2903884 RepID=UPI002E337239|nr:YafY family protein [Streptomyces sp. NBC_01485]